MRPAAVLRNLYPSFWFLFLPTARGQLGILHSPPPTEGKVLPAPKSSRLPLIPRRQAGACRQRRTRRQKRTDTNTGKHSVGTRRLYLWLPYLLGQLLPFNSLGAVGLLLPGGISPALRTWGSRCWHLLQFCGEALRCPRFKQRGLPSLSLFFSLYVPLSFPLLSLFLPPIFFLSPSPSPAPIFHFFSHSNLIFHFVYSPAL